MANPKLTHPGRHASWRSLHVPRVDKSTLTTYTQPCPGGHHRPASGMYISEALRVYFPTLQSPTQMEQLDA